MAINGASFSMGATFTPSGGTARTLKPLTSTAGDKVAYHLDDGSDLVLRPTLEFVNKAPAANAGAPNGYTQQRCELVIKRPKLLDNGKYTTDVVRISVAYDAENTNAEIDSLWEYLAHISTDSEIQDFRRGGGVA